MAKLTAEAKVGLLVLGSSVILLWMTMVVGKFEFGQAKGYRLTAVFDSVAGLDAKAAVRMAGVQIGTVEAVTLDDSRAKLVLRINPDVKILRGSEAAVKTMGLLGDKYVDIVPATQLTTREGAPAAAGKQGFYRDGDRMEQTLAASDADQLISKLSSIADDIKQVTTSLRNVFGSQKGERSLEDILADLRQTTSNIREFSYALRGDGSELVTRLNELALNLNAVVEDNRDNLKMTLENVREASKNAELALASIENVTKRIDRGEGTIGKLVSDDSMYNNIDSAAKGLSDYVGRVERLKTTIAFRSEYMFPDSKSYFTLELKPRPDQYYIAEIVSDPFAKYKRVETVTTPPGGTVVTESYEDKLLFSLEFAKRWGNLALRMGLIESQGGVGTDFYAFDDRVKFSVDAWNFNSKEPRNEHAHAKATATWSINKLFFVNAGYDNILNVDRRAAFIGAGLKFDDDDLKYLLGSVPMPK
ncbi:MAG: MlaD family protein [Nitrospiraceae bacterium]|nr:MlaD family protein [Nitrospiraceae bacterium]